MSPTAASEARWREYRIVAIGELKERGQEHANGLWIVEPTGPAPQGHGGRPSDPTAPHEMRPRGRRQWKRTEGGPRLRYRRTRSGAAQPDYRARATPRGFSAVARESESREKSETKYEEAIEQEHEQREEVAAELEREGPLEPEDDR